MKVTDLFVLIDDGKLKHHSGIIKQDDNAYSDLKATGTTRESYSMSHLQDYHKTLPRKSLAWHDLLQLS